MNILQFINTFPTEEKCLEHFAATRLERGIKCEKCGDTTKHYWLQDQKRFKCSKCKTKSSYKSGTLMENSKLTIQQWFMMLHLMTTTKKTFSALEMQRQLGIKRYEPVWYAMHKIRATMGKRDEKYKLMGEIEIDDAFFTTVDLDRDKEEEMKRGRGSQKKSQVMVMVESVPVTPEVKAAKFGKDTKHRPSRKMGFVKMVVMDDLASEGINYEVKKYVDPRTKVISDGWRGYNKLTEVVAIHKPETVPAKEAHKKLPWVHTNIGNSKRVLDGFHHSIGKGYLQNYLNEFCYKLNRRNFESDMFDRIMAAGVDGVWYKNKAQYYR